MCYDKNEISIKYGFYVSKLPTLTYMLCTTMRAKYIYIYACMSNNYIFMWFSKHKKVPLANYIHITKVYFKL